MRTSARNHFTGRITHIRQGTNSDEVELQLAGGERIVCMVTSDRALTLKLRAGGTAFALVSASSVILTIGRTDAFKLSARNQLVGSIKNLRTGAENTEVTLALMGGDTLVALVANESAKEMGLEDGKTVNAIFKASSVILGVAE